MIFLGKTYSISCSRKWWIFTVSKWLIFLFGQFITSKPLYVRPSVRPTYRVACTRLRTIQHHLKHWSEDTRKCSWLKRPPLSTPEIPRRATRVRNSQNRTKIMKPPYGIWENLRGKWSKSSSHLYLNANRCTEKILSFFYFFFILFLAADLWFFQRGENWVKLKVNKKIMNNEMNE